MVVLGGGLFLMSEVPLYQSFCLSRLAQRVRARKHAFVKHFIQVHLYKPHHYIIGYPSGGG
jgi:hypothetical protein